jgi:FG-GAP-like repeat
MRLALALVLLTGVASGETLPVDGRAVVRADLTQPTDRYDHAVLGDALEWGGLALSVDSCTECDGVQLTEVAITLPIDRVFEDVEARLADLDGDGRAEVIVVETDLALGASLAVYGPGGKIASTAFIGQPYRWLAPAGIADFDGDGRIEIAYVDRPHLVAELVFVRLAGDRLVETARLPGLTNHRIGDTFISGGLRDCGAGPELILASKDWTRMMRVRRGVVDDLGPMPASGLVLPSC